MPPTYSVRATVIDVRSDTPRPTDRFLVDTNVWAWKRYPAAGVASSGGSVPQVSDYGPYFDRITAAGATRYRVGTILAELAHLIETTEHAIYAAAVARLTLKDYRHNVPAERARVVRMIETVWTRVKADSDPLPLTLDGAFTDGALTRLAVAPVDGYDVFLIEAMAASGVSQILTDDGDFCCVAGIEVFTANPRVLAAARAQGRLVVR
jgi:hypothetical protein